VALQPCHECGQQISSQANACPSCGAPVRQSFGHTGERAEAEQPRFEIGPPQKEQQLPPIQDPAIIPTKTEVSGLAIASLVCAILIPPVGLILAIVALRSMKANPAAGGKGIAVAGVAVSSLFSLFIVMLVVVVAIPNLAKARKNSQIHACQSNLRTIEFAIQQWAIDKRKADDSEVYLEDLEPYFKDGIPRCPSGGEYELYIVDEKPTCTIEGHSIDYSY
jgi:competence protein ComGC